MAPDFSVDVSTATGTGLFRLHNVNLSPQQAACAAERIAKMLFTAPDGQTGRTLELYEQSTDFLHLPEYVPLNAMNWAYVVENIRRILEEG